MKYLKLFNSESEYLDYKYSQEYILPNISFIKDEKLLYESKYPSGIVRGIFLTETSNKVIICKDVSLFKSIAIDGSYIDMNLIDSHGRYTFDSKGLHTVEYELINPYVITELMFSNTDLYFVELGNSIECIKDSAFSYSRKLIKVIFGENLKRIGGSAFSDTSLSVIISNAKNAPTITNTTFKDVLKFGTLEYPENSDYSSWLSTDEGYLGSKNWNYDDSDIPYIQIDYSYESQFSFSNDCSILKLDGYVVNPDNFYSLPSGKHTIHVLLEDPTTIPQYLISHHPQITSVVLPETVTTITKGNFDYCSNLKSITFNSLPVLSGSGDVFKRLPESGTLYYPAEYNMLDYRILTGLSWEYVALT